MGSGGKREGAGRPTKGKNQRKAVTVSIELPALAALRQEARFSRLSLADVFNQRLKTSLETSPPEILSASYSEILNLSYQLDQEIKAATDENLKRLPPVPSVEKLRKSLSRMCQRQNVDRHSKAVQYWRKHYREDKRFRRMMDQIGRLLHKDLVTLIFDAVLPIKTHQEALALTCLEYDHFRIVIGRLLKGERDLKKAMSGFEETYRDAVKLMLKQEGRFTEYFYLSEDD
jgi:hypothetical protein